MRLITYICLLLLVVGIPLGAQTWTPDLGGDGIVPPAPTWRLDRDHFLLRGGAIELHAPRPAARGLSVLSIATTLPEDPRFEGRIRWQVQPSSVNCSYVLLCCLSQQGNTYDYVALAVGGEHHGIALVTLSLQLNPEGSASRIKYRETKTLIEEEGVASTHVFSIDYRVDYRRGVGWRLVISFPDKGGQPLELGTNEEFLPSLPTKNSLAWVCQYSPKNNEAWQLSHLRISSALGQSAPPPSDDPAPDPSPDPQPHPQPDPAPPIDTNPSKHVLISEMMAHPVRRKK